MLIHQKCGGRLVPAPSEDRQDTFVCERCGEEATGEHVVTVVDEETGQEIDL